MSSKLTIYVGPYIKLTKNFTPGCWHEFEDLVCNTRSELDKGFMILISNSNRFGKWIDSRDYDDLEVIDLALHPVVDEISRFAQFVSRFTDQCKRDGVEYEWHWGLVPYFS